MFANSSGNILNNYVSDYVVFDLETTGVSTSNDEVVEISALKVKAGSVVDEFSTLVNPGKPIPFYATNINGITDDMVNDAPAFKEVLADFISFAGDDVLVGHNIYRFDMKFIYRDSLKYYGKSVSNDYADTYCLAKSLFPELSCHKLTFLADYLGLSTEGAHRALYDCRMTQVLYERIGQELKKGVSGNMKICPQCGSPLVKRHGIHGEFWSCLSFPSCRYTCDK